MSKTIQTFKWFMASQKESPLNVAQYKLFSVNNLHLILLSAKYKDDST